MPEFLRLIPPTDALKILLENLTIPPPEAQTVDTLASLGRILAEPIVAPHALPSFSRSAVDGYAVKAEDTFGSGDSLPAYLRLAGEILMGAEAKIRVEQGAAALIHTGGMLPEGADAVVMLEHTQISRPGEIEVLRPVAVGENIIHAGEDIRAGQMVLSTGARIRPPEIGGLMALGILQVMVARKPRVGILASGDEIIPPSHDPQPGQVRDVNSYALAAQLMEAGAEPILYGIIPDELEALQQAAKRALDQSDLVLISAGSSASARDLTSQVIQSLGKPGVLVHGINIRPGKPTILAVCAGKAVFGLPGNPVSALVISRLLVVPVVEKLLGMPASRPWPSMPARLTVNIPSQTGREDWIAIKLIQTPEEYLAEPVFGKSNLIFMLASADGLVRIPPDLGGLNAGEIIEVWLV